MLKNELWKTETWGTSSSMDSQGTEESGESRSGEGMSGRSALPWDKPGEDESDESGTGEEGSGESETGEDESDESETGEEESGGSEIGEEESGESESGGEFPEGILPGGKMPGEESSQEDGSEEDESGESQDEESEEPTAEVREPSGRDKGSSSKKEESGFSPLLILALVLVGVLMFLGGMFVGRKTGKKKYSVQKPARPQKEMAGPVEETVRTEVINPVSEPLGSIPEGPGTIGKLHNIGMRKSQQDSLGVTRYRDGLLAVVADGMGGLSDGDKVSQKVVLTMLQDAPKLTGGNTEGALWQLVAHANREVNHMLGVSDGYKSGSTLLAVLVEKGRFQWISVGDSRIYLYRQGQLLQINREHVYEMDLLRKAVNGMMTFTEVAGDSQKKHVASFIGMGELKYVDSSMRSAATCPGDKLLLMSDGVFNTISEQEIRAVLAKGENAENTARLLEEEVLVRRNPKQDNFTAVILDI